MQNGDLAAYREAVQTANEHHQKADDWQKGGVALAAVATGLSAPTDSALGIAAATASPVAAYQIGQYFKGVAAQNSDGRLTAAQETARAVAHGVIAAATSAAGDHNALTAAISAGGAEAAAPYVSQWLYGEKDGSKLTAEQKQTVSSVLSLGGAAVGAAANGSAADVVVAGQAVRTAVENNYLSLKDINDLRTELKRAKTDKEQERIFEKYRKKGESQSRELRELCRGKDDECHLNAIAKLRNTNQAATTIIHNGLLLSLTQSGRNDLSAWGLALDSNLPDLTYHEGQLSAGAKLLDTGVKLSPIVGTALTAGGSKAVQALSGKKVPAIQTNRQPSAVDGEMFQTRSVDFRASNIGTKIHDGAQGKHIIGHNNYTPGKSTLNRNINAQELLNGIHSGTYPIVSKNNRKTIVVDFGKQIGIDGVSGLSTNFGTIHSGKKGVHIVPYNPSLIRKID